MFALFLLALYYSQIRRGVQVRVLERILSFISPVECSQCGRPNQSVCDECWQKLVPVRTPACFWCNTLTNEGKTCPSCARKTHITGVTIPFRLNGVVKDKVHGLKYGGDREVAKFFAGKLCEYIPQDTFDTICYVPSTGRSQRKRGYNQAKLLAKEISRTMRLPLEPALLRLTHTDQIGLNRAQRLSGVKGNFIARGNYTGKRILLVDDVVTTGATLNECAYTLKVAGASKVWAVAIAKK